MKVVLVFLLAVVMLSYVLVSMAVPSFVWGRVRVVGCDHRERSVIGFLTDQASRPATRAVCRGVGGRFPGVDLKAICEGLSLLRRVNRVVGVSAKINPSRCSCGATPRCRFVYENYKHIVSVSLSFTSRLVARIRRSASLTVRDYSISFAKLYPSYGGRLS